MEESTYQSIKRARANYTKIFVTLMAICILLGIIICFMIVFEHTGEYKVYQMSFGLGSDCTDEEADEYIEIIGQTLGEELNMGFSVYKIYGGSWDSEKIVYDGITARFIMDDMDGKLNENMVTDAIALAQSRTNNGFVMLETYWMDANLIFPIDYDSPAAD